MRIFALFFVFILSACVYGPTVEHKKPLDVLNADNYETTAQGESSSFVVPVAKRKERVTKIQGRLVQDIDGLEVPLKFTALVLESAKGELRQKTSSDINGQFIFSGIVHNGDYRIRVDSPKWSGETKLTVDNYLIENLVLRVLPKK